MKLSTREINILLSGLTALAENARKAQDLVFDNDLYHSIENYIEELGNLNLKLSKEG